MNHHLSPDIKRCSAKPLGLRVFTTRLGLENKTQPREKDRRGPPRIPPSTSGRVRAQDLEKPSHNMLLLRSVSDVETGPTCFPREMGHIPSFLIEAIPFPEMGMIWGTRKMRAGMGCNMKAEHTASLGLLTRDLAEGSVTSKFRF